MKRIIHTEILAEHYERLREVVYSRKDVSMHEIIRKLIEDYVSLLPKMTPVPDGYSSRKLRRRNPITSKGDE